MKVVEFKEPGYFIVAALEPGYEFAFYLYKDEEVIERRSYTSSAAAVFKIIEPGRYQSKVFRRSLEGTKTRGLSNTVEFCIEDLILDEGEVNLPMERDKWHSWVRDLRKTTVPLSNRWYVLEPEQHDATSMMESGWKFRNHPSLNPAREIDWAAPGKKSRAWGFHFHAWEFMDPLLKEFQQSGAPEMLHWMYESATNWWNFARSNEDEEAMVWYDMSLSLRTPRLARLILLLANSHEPDRALELLEPIVKHAEALLRKEAYNANNNHGFFAAAASIELPKLMPFLPLAGLLTHIGEKRMNEMVDRQFAVDGGHLEHSPDYHRMLLGSFEKALDAGLISDAETERRIHLAAHALGWMVQPDGKLVQFGDTDAFDVDAARLHSHDNNTEFILSNGTRGNPADEELYVLPNSGYAFVRSPQPSAKSERVKSGYLAFLAGFHSRAHKHADDLTFTWFDKGHEIIVDSGRYGYEQPLPPDAPERKKGFYYGAPERIYVESTLAHNTIQVDGENIERRERIPYGSALGDCTITDGRFILRGAVEHNTYRHQRLLKYEPGHSLEIIDTLSQMESDIEAVSWFNVNGEFDATIEDNFILFYMPGRKHMIRIIGDGELVHPVRGQVSPLRGWRSKFDGEIQPVWNFGYKFVAGNEIRHHVRIELISAANQNS